MRPVIIWVTLAILSIYLGVALAVPLEAKSPYEILGVSPQATDKEIRSAYRTLMLRNHPDVGGNEEMAKAINRAFEILSEPKAKATFDLWQASMEKTKNFSVGRINPREWQEAFAGRNKRLNEIAINLEKKVVELRSRKLKPNIIEIIQMAKIEISAQAEHLVDFDFLPKRHFLNTDIYTLGKVFAIGRSPLSIETKEGLALAVFEILNFRRELMLNEYLYGAMSGSAEGYLYNLRRDIEDEQNFVSKRTARGQLLRRLHRTIDEYIKQNTTSSRDRAGVESCELRLLGRVVE